MMDRAKAWLGFLIILIGSAPARADQPGVFRYPEPEHENWLKMWSNEIPPNDLRTVYRLPGDSHSKYYFVEISDYEENSMTEIKDNAGRVIYSTGISAAEYGFRKSRDGITLFFRYPDFDPSAPLTDANYIAFRISGGKHTGYYCEPSHATLASVYGSKNATRQQLIARSIKEPDKLTDYLTSMDFNYRRDICKALEAENP